MSLSIPRVKPLGWGLFEILTSSQITQMDLNISLLDDEIQGTRIVDASNALRLWTATTIPQVGTDTYADIIPMRLSRTYGVNADTQRLIFMVGTDSTGSPANEARIARSADGSAFDPATQRLSTLTTFLSPTAGFPGAAGELMLINGAHQFAYSADSGATWTLSSLVSITDNIGVMHYVSGTGAAAGYYLLTDGATSNFARASSMANLANTPTYSTIGSGGFAFNTTQSIVSDGASVLLIACTFSDGCRVYRSTDGGATWMLAYTTGGTVMSLVWSDYWKKFFLVDNSAGVLASSSDGASWSLVRSGLTSANGFLVSARALIACGPALALPSATGTTGGLVLSLDQGLTWNYHYIGVSGVYPTVFRATRERIYAANGKTLWRSGLLGSPAAEL